MVSLWKKVVATLAVVLILLLVRFLFFSDMHELQTVYDLNNDGIMEKYHLTGGKLTIKQPGSIDWSSPPEWDIQAFVLDDVTGDKEPELVMVLWKRGSFGRHKPIWNGRKEDTKYSCHLFLYQISNNKMIPRWCSSALDRPIKSISVQKNLSGNSFLAVEEGRYSFYCCGHALFLGKQYTDWGWKQWGFYRI
ncbi:MAG: hypothetical protein ACOX6L_10270 [Syntrophomonadaceae bacterium]|jgi:hypothetical protein